MNKDLAEGNQKDINLGSWTDHLGSEELARAIINSALDAVILIDTQGQIIFWNDAAQKMFGYPFRKALGKKMHDLISPERYRSDQVRGFQKFQKTGQGLAVGKTLELVGKKNSGKEFPIALSVSALEIKGEWGALGIIRDITERREMLNQIQRSEEKFKKLSGELDAILDHIPGLVFYKDTENRFLRVNQFVADAHGMTKEELTGKNLFDLYPEDEAQAYWDDDLEVIERGTPKLNIEEPWETEEGTRWVLTSKIPFRDEQGEIAGVIGISLDITDRVHIQKALRESERRFKQVYNSVPVSLWEEDFSPIISELRKLKSQGVKDMASYLDDQPEFIDRMGKIVNILDVNQTTLDMFGAKDKEELLGSIDKVLTADSKGILREEILAIHDGKGFFQGETVNRTLQGEELNVLLTMTIPQEKKEVDHVLISLMDITARKKLQQEVEKLAREDPLIGCYNRRHFFFLADHEIARASRYEHPLSLLMMDLDHFKRINDQYGHGVGDEVLIATAERLKEGLRVTDVFARYGGEEFIALLPETDLEGAARVAERLRKQAEKNLEIDQLNLTVPISLGVAALEPGDMADVGTLIDRADQALYAAKDAGRNQVKCWGMDI